MNVLQKLGFDYEINLEENPFQPGLITVVNKERYLLFNGENELNAEITGKMMYEATSQENYPVVGDWVLFQQFDNDLAIIHEILPRKSLLERKKPGEKTERQPIVSNVDTTFIIQALDRDLNIKRFERYLVMLSKANINPILLISKCDLETDDKTFEKLDQLKKQFSNVPIIQFSNFDKQSLEAIKENLEPGKSYCIMGSSGVGKSTLLNNLLGKEILETNEVRFNDSRGRHTTTRRQLFLLDNYIRIIDTPGIRELGMLDSEQDIDNTFENVVNIAKFCKFNNCTHTNEPGCAILKALENGEINAEQYSNYQKLKREATFYESTVFEKKQKDKAFGKMVKQVLKQDRKNKY